MLFCPIEICSYVIMSYKICSYVIMSYKPYFSTAS